MNDEQILEMGGDEEDIRKFAEEHGATNPMPPNTKKCCGDCGFAQLPPKTGIDCVQPKCPCHTPNTKKCERRVCQYCQVYGINYSCHTPPPEKEKCDGTCRTPECYLARGNKVFDGNTGEQIREYAKPTPAVEDWEEQFSNFYGAMFECGDFEELMNKIRSLLKSDRKRTIELLDEVKDYAKANGIKSVIDYIELMQGKTNLK